MILPDLNLLLYAYNPFVEQHANALAWWENAVNDTELIGLPYEILFGFVRIATNRRLGDAAVSLTEAREVVEGWVKLPNSTILTPSPDHLTQVFALMRQAHAVGRVLSDAILAAYAISNRATLYSNDSDFARFDGLSWKNPL